MEGKGKHKVSGDIPMYNNPEYAEELLTSLLEYSNDCVVITDKDFRIIDGNRNAEVQFGLARKETIGKYLYEVSPGLRESGRLQKYTEVLETGDPFISNDVIIHPSSGSINVNIKAINVMGTLVLLIANVSEKHSIINELRYRKDFDNLIVNLSAKFINKQVREFDEAIEETLESIGEFADADRSYVFQFSKNKILMRNSHEWVRNSIPKSMSKLQNLACDDYSWWMEQIYSKPIVEVPSIKDLPKEAKTEREMFELQKISSILSVPLVLNDEVIGFLGFDSLEENKQWREEVYLMLKLVAVIIVNAIERKRAEKVLKTQEEKYRQIFDLSPEAIVLIDLKGRIVEINGRVNDWLGYNVGEVVGKNIYRLPFITFEGKKSLRKRIIERRKGREIDPYELEFVSKKDEVRTGWVIVTQVYDDEEKHVYDLVMVSDVTERNETIKQLKVAKEGAEESDRLKSAFLATMQHELRTPLNGIIGFSGILKDSEFEPSEVKEYNQIIYNSGMQLLGIINDILDVSSLVTKSIALNQEKLDVVKLFKGIFDEYQLMIRHNPEKSHLKLSVDLSSKKALNIVSDSYRFEQIIRNLLDNAIKFTYEGSISFGFELVDNAWLKCYVKDSGIGIPMNKHHIIFESFRQVDESSTREFGGSGIGLAICKNLIELMGGKIWFDSKPDKGSTFYFTFPLIENATETSAEELEFEELDEYNWKGKNILIVEDNMLNYRFLNMTIRKTGAHIIHAENGRRALDILKTHVQLHAVLMDIQLPDIDGLEVTRKLKEMRPDLNVIAQTAFTMLSDKNQCMQAGCSDYISKPVEKGRLLRILNKYVSD